MAEGEDDIQPPLCLQRSLDLMEIRKQELTCNSEVRVEKKN
jgi:hypothetical protein